MGKGDIKSRRGKLFSGSYGKKRPRKKQKNTGIIVNAKQEENIKNSKSKSPVEVKEPKKRVNEEQEAVATSEQTERAGEVKEIKEEVKVPEEITEEPEKEE